MDELSILLLFVCIITFAKGSDKKPACPVELRGYEICDSGDCQKLAQEFSASMNTSVDPCEDFYSYICGTWTERPLIASNQFLIASFDKLAKSVKLHIKDILTDVKPGSTKALSKAREIYKSCIDKRTIDQNSVKLIKEQLEIIEGWPLLRSQSIFSFSSKSWQSVFKKFFKIFHPEFLFYIKIGTNDNPTHSRIIKLHQPEPAFAQPITSESHWEDQVMKNYRIYIHNVALYIREKSGKSITNPNFEQDLNEMIEFQLDLLKISGWSKGSKAISQRYSLLTIEDFQNWYNYYAQNHLNAKIDWLEIIQLYFKSLQTKIKISEKIAVTNIEFFKKLPSILQKTKPRAIINYIAWRLVDFLIDYSDTKLVDFKNEFNSKAFKKNPAQLPRETVCLKNLNLEQAIALEYVNRHFSGADRKKSKQIVNHILRTAEKTVSKINWMDPESKLRTVQKIQAILPLVGHPDLFISPAIEDYYKSFRLGSYYLEHMINLHQFLNRKYIEKYITPYDRKEWDKPPTWVYAAYSLTTNNIIISAAFLQYPLFNIGRPDVLNYAVIGTIIAHEVFHAIDMTGRKFDMDGHLKDLLSPSTKKMQDEMSECFVDYYNKLEILEISDKDNIVCNDGKRTLSENMADLFGLQVAYDAFKELQISSGVKDIRLVGMLDKNSDKLFFMQFALYLCAYRMKRSTALTHLQDCHATPEARVKGSISNHKDFARVFNCEPDTPMNPTHKCSSY
ncbi:neprilysin-11-like [Prorops nasuta]|uniref:neprilysin-11-like n=1 Tax=Prorops nasuta TaxID=863751 RepID=UPI0034CDA8B9